MEDISLKIKNYKCFGDDPQGFDVIKPINVLIGRNNSGKSSLLDLIEYVIMPPKDLKGLLKNLGHQKREPEIYVAFPLKEDELKKVFHESTSGGEISGNHWLFAKQFVDRKITILMTNSNEKHFSDLDSDTDANMDRTIRYWEELGRRITLPFQGNKFKRLHAERDIQPEKASNNNVYVNGNGGGATNIIERFVNNANLPSELVEVKLLQELNKIVEPDSSFKDIVVQQYDEGKWEIFLEEEQKGRIALSQSGSGLKTIILVLIYTILVPCDEKLELDKYIFAFEELENNLHPSLQRRLFLYLRDLALKENARFFLTTHSNVVIDLFSNDPAAQIYHITHDGCEAISTPVINYIDKTGILDDLDVRASDLLQSNGIIWVEGPSDRLYINRWMELWSDDIKLREGAHYQSIFYGGRLLNHLSAENPEIDQQNLIKILSTNRNVAILIDSDKTSESDEINDTKKRIQNEIESVGGLCWITKGKEIENYIPKSAIDSLAENYEMKVEKGFGLYEVFDDYLKHLKETDTGERGKKRFPRNKLSFADEIRPHLNKENLSGMLDLDTQMNEMTARIKRWNNM
ncbi:MAG TPA: ATP-binding protein [Methanothrix sp.]|nr:ATP-binding protein [Methanothrix sp.]HPJ83611.1 ATP-binding protein [Methanothrix sp.]